MNTKIFEQYVLGIVGQTEPCWLLVDTQMILDPLYIGLFARGYFALEHHVVVAFVVRFGDFIIMFGSALDQRQVASSAHARRIEELAYERGNQLLVEFVVYFAAVNAAGHERLHRLPLDEVA